MITAFVNGCFDILHVGHVRMLSYAKRQAMIMAEADLNEHHKARLVVAINSDESVRKLKGNHKPVICQEHRKEMLEALKFVDEVIIFDELSPRDLIAKLRPSFIVKGPDYDYLAHQTYSGIFVAIYPGIKSESTSDIIQRMKQNDYDLK